VQTALWKPADMGYKNLPDNPLHGLPGPTNNLIMHSEEIRKMLLKHIQGIIFSRKYISIPGDFLKSIRTVKLKISLHVHPFTFVDYHNYFKLKKLIVFGNKEIAKVY